MIKLSQGANPPRIVYRNRGTNIIGDAANMKVTNIDELNQFVKREYRVPFKLSGV